MATSKINLSTTQYVRINVGYGQLIVEALAGDVHIVLNDTQPAVKNTAFHKLTDRQRLKLDKLDTNVWALAKNSGSHAAVTEFPSSSVVPSVIGTVGVGDLTVDAWGAQKVSVPQSLFHGMWTYDIPNSMWFMYENGTQVYTSTNIVSVGGVAQITADATNTVCLLESRECPRYQPNRGHLFSTAGWFPSKTAGGVRDFGLFTTENGVFFRLKSDGLLYAVLRRAGVEVLEEEIDTSVLTGFDVEKSNIYDIQFQWRSAGNYKFFIGNPATGVQQLVHTFDLLGTLTSASIDNPALPVAFKATRTTADVEMNIGCADITAENGQDNNTEQYGSAYAESVAVNGTDAPVIVIRNPLQINSTTNTRTITLARITVTCAKKATFKVWMTRDPASITGATFKRTSSSSYIETDSPDMDATAVRATSVTTASMSIVRAFNVEAAVTQFADNPYRGRIEFPIVRGDYLVITCTASTAVAECNIEWGEQV